MAHGHVFYHLLQLLARCLTLESYAALINLFLTNSGDSRKNAVTASRACGGM